MALPPSPSLGSEFPAATRDDWRRAVDQVLGKGADLSAEQLEQRFRKQLISVLDDGIEVQPLYTADDVDPSVLAGRGLPGMSPYVRGSTVAGASQSGWEVRQRVDLTHSAPDDAAPDDAAQASVRILAELERGATGVLLGLAPDVAGGLDQEQLVDLLDQTLAGVYLELVPVTLDAGAHAVEAARALDALWQRRDVADSEARGVFGIDPVGRLAREGGDPTGMSGVWVAAAELARGAITRQMAVRAVVADGLPYHEAGAPDALELACLLAAGVEAVRGLTAAGLSVDEAMGQIELRVAATADQFVTIAKLRALRSLWDRIGEVVGADPAARAPRVHAVTSTVMLTRYDPWVNLLRNTVACFAAGIGGADAITVLPHDAARTPGAPSEVARRMARNTQAILTDESALAKVIDAGGGSWYVESLTDALADATWEHFQQIEGSGGLVASLSSGDLQQRVADAWTARARRLATRAEAITGISEFPDIDEPAPDADTSVAPPVADGGGVTPLRRVRRAEGFEALREAVDEHERRHGRRPEVVLVGIGTAADHTARSSFAKNLYEAGGLRTVLVELDEAGDLAGVADDVAAREPATVCLCSSDARYADAVEAVARALSQAGVRHLSLAGRPGDQGAAWAAAGIAEYVFAGCDALSVLQEAHRRAGIASASEGAHE